MSKKKTLGSKFGGSATTDLRDVRHNVVVGCVRGYGECFLKSDRLRRSM